VVTEHREILVMALQAVRTRPPAACTTRKPQQLITQLFRRTAEGKIIGGIDAG
jgi:hypothetical protein